jgi:hypothetical protein
MSRDRTPDSHDFPTRPYDLVREFVIALIVVIVLSVGPAVIFSSPDDPAITMSGWAKAAPNDVVATAAGELAGTTTSATYGPPYNNNGTGQQLGPLSLQKWAGVRIPVNSANLVLSPLGNLSGDTKLTSALDTWKTANPTTQTNWATAYSNALTKAPNGDPAKVPAGNYGPVPTLSTDFLQLAKTGGLEGALVSSGNFYGGDQTQSLLLLSDGAYIENLADAQQLGGDQWGMMNEVGNAPGQPWMWLYTFWYQIPPFSTSPNADAQVWAIMMFLTLCLMFLPFIPGLRSIPRWIPIHKLIWRNYYHKHQHT